MAEFWPSDPRPSAVSAPELIDPSLSYEVDQGYKVRRPKWSRPRRRWTLEYLGLDTLHMRILRDMLLRHRLGALEVSWTHPTALDVAVMQPTTPVRLLYVHGLWTGMWVGISNGPNPSLNGGFFQVTWDTNGSLYLNNTTAQGVQGNCTVVIYVPHVLVVPGQEESMPGPATLIGPEQLAYAPGGLRSGYFNWSVQLEEQF